MKKLIYFSIVCFYFSISPVNALSPSMSGFTKMSLQTPSSIQLVMEEKKGNIIKKEGASFTIQSEDGDTYDAPVVSGYAVGDLVYHTEPVNRSVLITGHAN